MRRPFLTILEEAGPASTAMPASARSVSSEDLPSPHSVVAREQIPRVMQDGYFDSVLYHSFMRYARVTRVPVHQIEGFLRRGANPNWVDAGSDSPMEYAIHNQRADLVSLYLEYGADPQMFPNLPGSNVVRTAAKVELNHESQTFEMTRHLLERGARPNLIFNNDTTLFEYALMKKNEPLVSLLCEFGVKTEITFTRGSPLSNAFLKTPYSKTRFNLAIKYCKNVNYQDIGGNTALHYAFDLFNTRPRLARDVILTLIQHGADADIKNKNGNTPVNIGLLRIRRNVEKGVTSRDFLVKTEEYFNKMVRRGLEWREELVRPATRAEEEEDSEDDEEGETEGKRAKKMD